MKRKKKKKNGVKTLQIFLQLDAFFTSFELSPKLLTQIIFFIQFKPWMSIASAIRMNYPKMRTTMHCMYDL